jgi:hypothetical protein
MSDVAVQAPPEDAFGVSSGAEESEREITAVTDAAVRLSLKWNEEAAELPVPVVAMALTHLLAGLISWQDDFEAALGLTWEAVEEEAREMRRQLELRAAIEEEKGEAE